MKPEQVASYRFVQQIIAHPRVDALYLFGSHAIGNPNRRSDIDLYVSGESISERDMVELRAMTAYADTLRYIDLKHYEAERKAAEEDTTGYRRDELAYNLARATRLDRLDVVAGPRPLTPGGPTVRQLQLGLYRTWGLAIDRLDVHQGQRPTKAAVEADRRMHDVESAKLFDDAFVCAYKFLRSELKSFRGYRMYTPRDALCGAYMNGLIEDEPGWLSMLADHIWIEDYLVEAEGRGAYHALSAPQRLLLDIIWCGLRWRGNDQDASQDRRLARFLFGFRSAYWMNAQQRVSEEIALAPRQETTMQRFVERVPAHVACLKRNHALLRSVVFSPNDRRR